MLASESDIDKYVSLGDVVNYGPWSNECVDLLESLDAVKLTGNHEEYFLSGTYPGKNTLVQSFFRKCLESFDRREFISKYQQEYLLGNYICRHTINNLYLFSDSEISVKGNFIIGHSHHQFDNREDDYHVVNVGSVGQNRREINVINYALYDTDKDLIELKSLIYSIDPLLQKMKELDYPDDCIEYYLNKAVRR